MPAVTRFTRFTRFTLVLDPCAWTAREVERVARLAGEMAAEIDAVFIEDDSLMRAAASPLTRFVGASAAAEERVDAAGMTRALRVRSLRARTWLEAAAARTAVKWRFTDARGPLAGEIAQRARANALLVVAATTMREQAGRTAATRALSLESALAQAGGAVLIIAETTPERGGVWVIDGREPELLALGQSVARAIGQPLAIAVRGEMPGATARRTKETPAPATTLRFASDADLLARARAWRPALVVASEAGASLETLAALAVETSVLIVRSPRALGTEPAPA